MTWQMQDGSSIQVDVPQPKIAVLHDGISVTVAGRSSQGLEVVKKTKARYPKEIAQEINIERDKLRTNEIDEFKKANPNCQGVSIEQVLRGRQWALSFLITGFNESGQPEIRVVTEWDFGTYAYVGYGANAIGAAGNVALWALARRQPVLGSNLDVLTYAVFEAKKLAELSPGIGTKTDLFIFKDKQEPHILREAHIKDLETIYTNMNQLDLGEAHLKTLREIVGE